MIVALALAAHAAPSCDEIDPQAPVQLELTVGGGPLTPGATMTFSVTGAVPGDRVGFVVGSGDNRDACPEVLGGACLDVSGPTVIGTAVADGSGTAVVVGVIPASLSAYELAFQAASLGCDAPVLSEVLLVDVAEPVAEPCAFSPSKWKTDCQPGNVGCFRDEWFSTVYPEGLALGGVQDLELPDPVAIQDLFAVAAEHGGPSGSFVAALVALRLNLDFAASGAFGAHVGLHGAQLPSGPHAGWTAVDVLALAEATEPTEATVDLIGELAWFDGAYRSCRPSDLPSPDSDLVD